MLETRRKYEMHYETKEHIQSVEIDLSSIPANALRSVTEISLSEMLKSPKVLRSPCNYFRDWRGLADLMEVKWSPNMNQDDKRVFKILDSWKEHEGSTFGRLLKFLQKIDRYDIYDDILDMMYNDARIHQYKTELEVVLKTLIPSEQEDYEILTVEDVCRKKNVQSFQIYEAFVLYTDQDERFAKELIEKIEIDCKLNLCVKSEYCNGATIFEYDTTVKSVSEKCPIVIHTNNFKSNNGGDFVTKFARGIVLECRTGNTIPCVYMKLDTSRELKMCHRLDLL